MRCICLVLPHAALPHAALARTSKLILFSDHRLELMFRVIIHCLNFVFVSEFRAYILFLSNVYMVAFIMCIV